VGRSTSNKNREQCWILVGQYRPPFWYARRVHSTRGGPASVEFDAAWVLGREETQANVVGFFHTHPSGLHAVSERDVRTMRGWVSAFGKPLLCVVQCDAVCYGFRFDNADSRGVALPACAVFGRGVVIAVDEPVRSAQGEPQVPA
jgi:proteasome lid subunit RPN8/RPN11